MHGVNWQLSFNFFACSCPDLPTPFVEEVIFIPFCAPAPLVKYYLTIETWVYFWALYSVPLVYVSVLFFPIYFIDYAITVVLFSLLYSPLPCTPPPTCIPPLQFMSMGHTYKFLGFYISYTILNLPLSIFYLPFMLLIPCTFFSLYPPPNPLLITLHVISISVILILFQLYVQFIVVFCFFQVQLLIIVSLLSFYCSYFYLFLR